MSANESAHSDENVPLGTQWLRAQPKPAKTYGLCTSCRSVEVELVQVIGTRDLSYMGENDRYPVGYGCEVCA